MSKRKWSITGDDWNDLTRHTRKGKRCARCGERWPCFRARTRRLVGAAFSAALRHEQEARALRKAIRTFLGYAYSDTVTKSDTGWLHALDDLEAAIGYRAADAEAEEPGNAGES